MKFISKKIVPAIFHIKSCERFSFNVRNSLSPYIIASSRSYSVFNQNNSKESIHRKHYLFDNSNITFNHLSRPPHKIQVRHGSDYVDGSILYKWIAESTPVEYTQNFLISIHDFSGLPWWATIVGTTLALRCVITLPLSIYQTLILAKVENIALVEMPELSKDIRKEVAKLALENNWDEKRTQKTYKRMLKSKWDSLVIKENCHPFKGTITLWFQLPLWVFFTAALRNIAYMLPHKDAAAQIQYLQMSVGGFLWIPNLTLPDHTWFLPALLGICNLAIIEMQTLRRVRQAPLTQKYITNFFRCLSLALIPISAMVPSAVCLYWTTSSLIGFGQNLFLMSNSVRHAFNIPDTPTTLEKPYSQLLHDIKERGRNVRNYFKKGVY
ncbi:hypothetical protein O3M35_008375 [Rhynocoris fuscipes]|uniref:Membrane insertase YidC/Oxa/ALB C-terminal domain-containing protein n=1 Tax=Rhynocoris fuscipes TaxID=488301 RepID=A0AAW1DBA9_9HEMI